MTAGSAKLEISIQCSLHDRSLHIEDVFCPETAMSSTNVSDVPLETGMLPMSEDWFSNFNDLARTSSLPEPPSRRPVLSPSLSRALPSLPSSWPQQLLDAFISVHRNGEKGACRFLSFLVLILTNHDANSITAIGLSLVSKGIRVLPDQLGALKSLEVRGFTLTHFSIFRASSRHKRMLYLY